MRRLPVVDYHELPELGGGEPPDMEVITRMVADYAGKRAESFAGSFLAHGLLHAGFTAEAEAHAAALGKALGEQARRCVVFRARYPLTELRRLARRIVDDADEDDRMDAVWGAGVDVRHNQVRVALDEWDENMVAVVRERYGSDRVAFEVRTRLTPAAEAPR